MRWTEEMAEAIVQLQAIYLSGDFDRYWSFPIAKDQQRLHPGHSDSVTSPEERGRRGFWKKAGYENIPGIRFGNQT